MATKAKPPSRREKHLEYVANVWRARYYEAKRLYEQATGRKFPAMRQLHVEKGE